MRELVTGATGFIGAALVLELLKQTDHELVCLVRDNAADSSVRLQQVLEKAIDAYDQADLKPELARVTAVVGDLKPDGSLPSAQQLGQIERVWHCAGCLKFLAQDEAEIFNHNVKGTARLLQLATAAGASEFNYMSTAYVCGNTTGVIYERDSGEISNTANYYEKSKITAEQLVREHDHIRTRIFRPSVVIGNSKTKASFSATGFYGLLNALDLTVATAEREGLLDELQNSSARMQADPTVSLNLIPVDTVVQNAVKIAMSSSDRETYHLTNATAPTGAETVAAAFVSHGLPAPQFVSELSDPTPLERLLDRDRRLAYFRSFMVEERIFDLANTNAVLGEEASRQDLPQSELEHYAAAYRSQIKHPEPAL